MKMCPMNGLIKITNTQGSPYLTHSLQDLANFPSGIKTHEQNTRKSTTASSQKEINITVDTVDASSNAGGRSPGRRRRPSAEQRPQYHLPSGLHRTLVK